MATIPPDQISAIKDQVRKSIPSYDEKVDGFAHQQDVCDLDQPIERDTCTITTYCTNINNI